MQKLLNKLAKVATTLDIKKEKGFADRLDTVLETISKKANSEEEILTDEDQEELDQALQKEIDEKEKLEQRQQYGYKNDNLHENLLSKHDIYLMKDVDLQNPRSGLGGGAFGEVYRSVFEGKEVATKITSAKPHTIDRFNDEIYVWKKILEIKDSLSPKTQRHLPEIYQLIRDKNEDGSEREIIVMEKLEPLDPIVKSFFYSYPEKGRLAHILNLIKDQEFLYKIFVNGFKFYRESFPHIYLSSSDIDQLEKDVLSYRFTKELSNKSKINPLHGITEITEDFKAYLATVTKKVPSVKMYILFFFKELLGQAMHSQIPLNNPEKDGGTFGTKALEEIPELRSLVLALKELGSKGIYFRDLHKNNLMQRPHTKEIVLIDVGLYDVPGKRENRYDKLPEDY